MRRSRSYLPSILIVLGLSFACDDRPAHTGTAERSADDEVRPVHLTLDPYMGRLRQIAVDVGGERRHFLFDTGGGLTLVDPGVTSSIGCVPHGRLTGFRMSGERVEFRNCGSASVGLGPTRIDREVAVFDLMALLPEDWPPLAGVISLHTFQDRAITIDLADDQLVLETPQSLTDRTSNMSELAMHVEREVEGRGFSVYLEAMADQGRLRLLLDSGNLAGFILAPHALNQLSLEPPGGEEAGDQEARLESIELELRGLDPTDTPVLVRDIRHDGVIDAAFMERFIFTFDFPTGRAWAVRRDGNTGT